jgi:Family of unknown function (DUF6504)
VSRVYGEQVDVSLRCGKPARFVWRDQLYTVLAVRDRWVSTPEGLPGRAEGPPSSGAREFWQVEALAGRGAASRSYELRQETATGKWLLSRAWD